MCLSQVFQLYRSAVNCWSTILNWTGLQVKLRSIQSVHMWISSGNKDLKAMVLLDTMTPMKSLKGAREQKNPTNVKTLCMANIRNNLIKLKCVPYERPPWTTVAESVPRPFSHLWNMFSLGLILISNWKHHITHIVFVLLIHVDNTTTTMTRMNKTGRVQKFHKNMRKRQIASRKCNSDVVTFEHFWKHILKVVLPLVPTRIKPEGNLPSTKYWLGAWTAVTASHFSHSG